MDSLTTVFNFTMGRNVFAILLESVRKVSLLEHKVFEQVDDKKELKKIFYVFTVSGERIGIDDAANPIYESLAQFEVDEQQYSEAFHIYEDLLKALDSYKTFALTSEK